MLEWHFKHSSPAGPGLAQSWEIKHSLFPGENAQNTLLTPVDLDVQKHFYSCESPP